MGTPERPYGARKFWFAAAALVAAVALLLTWTPYFGSHRPPTESERVSSYFAERLGEAALCERISWQAFQRYGVLFGGGEMP